MMHERAASRFARVRPGDANEARAVMVRSGEVLDRDIEPTPSSMQGERLRPLAVDKATVRQVG